MLASLSFSRGFCSCVRRVRFHQTTGDMFRVLRPGRPQCEWILLGTADFTPPAPPPQPELAASSCPAFFSFVCFILLLYFPPSWLICSVGKVVFEPPVRKRCASLRHFGGGVQLQRGNSQNLGDLLGGVLSAISW